MRSHPAAASEQPRPLEDSTRPVFCLSLRAGAEIGLAARVIQALARRSLLPERWHLVTAGDVLLMDLQIREVSSDQGERLAEALRQIVGVEEVLTSRFLRRSAA